MSGASTLRVWRKADGWKVVGVMAFANWASLTLAVIAFYGFVPAREALTLWLPAILIAFALSSVPFRSFVYGRPTGTSGAVIFCTLVSLSACLSIHTASVLFGAMIIASKSGFSGDEEIGYWEAVGSGFVNLDHWHYLMVSGSVVIAALTGIFAKLIIGEGSGQISGEERNE